MPVILGVIPLRATSQSSNTNGLDPSRAITQYVHESWQNRDGSLQGAVRALYQTKDGYLWIGTKSGLYRFDGDHFRLFDKSNTPAMTNNNIAALLQTRDGALWCGTSGGLLKYHNNQFKNFILRDGLNNDNILSLFEDGDGTLWIGTVEGLSVLRNGVITSFPLTENNAVFQISSLSGDGNGNIWIGTNGRDLFHIKKGKVRSLHYETKKVSSRNIVFCGKDGRVWIGTQYGLCLLWKNTFRWFTTKEGLSSNLVSSVFEDSRGTLWIGTSGGGVNRFVDGQFSTYSTKERLTNDYIGAFAQDREGNLWIGTADGIDLLRNGKFIVYTTSEGLQNDVLWCVYGARNGDIWAGTNGGGVARLRNGRFTSYSTKDGLSGDVVRSILEDHNGSIWIGSRGGGLDVIRNGIVTNVTKTYDVPSPYVYAIFEDSKRQIWIGSYGGLSVLRDGRFQTFSVSDGLPHNFVRTITESRDGTLWIGTNQGLSSFKNGRFRSFSVNNGLASDVIMSLYEDREGILWIGTYNGGLIVLKEGKFTSVKKENGFADDIVYSTLDDANGKLWFGCDNGIASAIRSELIDFVDGRISTVRTHSYRKADGLRAVESNGGSQPSAWKSRDGRLWFSTIKGLAVIDPMALNVNTTPPPVAIDYVFADDKPLVLSPDIEVDAGNEKLEIHYAGLSFQAPHTMSYRYILEGYDRTWVEAGTRRTVSYNNLSPGDYRFRVKAANIDGVWNQEGATMTLTLKPFFYQTKVFYGVSFILLAAGAIILYTRRVRRFVERNIELERKVTERTQETLVQKRALERTNEELSNLLHRLEEKSRLLEEAKIRAEEANNAKSQFLANVSHELRTPLNSVIGFANVLLKNKRTTIDPREVLYLERILENGKHLLDIINQILDLSKVEAGQTHLEITDVSLSMLIHETLDQFVDRFSNNEVEILRKLPHPMALLQTDFGKLKQVLINLVANAIKFTEKGSITVRAGVHPKTRKPMRIDVIDTGVGIPLDRVSSIFESFHQIDSGTKRKFEGTGLGLAISRSLCELIGYQLEVKSQPGQGSVFSVVIDATDDSITYESLDEPDPQYLQSGRSTIDPEHVQEQILRLLQPFSHGKWAHLNLNSIALFGRNLKHALSHTQRVRLRDTIAHYLERTLPAIQAIVQKTRHNSIEPDIVESLRVHAEKLAFVLKSSSFHETTNLDEIARFEQVIPLHVDEILHAFRAIRKELVADYRCNPTVVIAEMLKNLQSSFEQNHIRVLNNAVAQQSLVVISSKDFSRAFQTILDFFVRRPTSGKARMISVNGRTYLDRWLLEVSDSGILLKPDLWKTFFDPQTKGSTLVDAAEVLQKYEGDVSIKESVPDKGTTILMRLKLG
ncbi:MAG: hypothetical protein HYY49_08290 [Ignavibacteriales bacterium]|nr:hypothetical protein [Ignavibacteriales bacterium]